MSSQLKVYLESAKEIALKSGEILQQYWGKLSNIQEKTSSSDLVTEADQASEEYVIGEIHHRYPSHTILSEESGLSIEGSGGYTWVVDPLDGTTNYTHQYPMVAVSIALVEENVPLVGVVYNPFHQELFSAYKGGGSFLNDKPLKVSTVHSLERSLLATGFAYDRRETADNNYGEFCHMTHISQGVRRGGSAALDLAYVAAGRLDGYWERGLNPWDIAAGVLLIEEAGGRVSSYEGSSLDLDSGRILASNCNIHPLLIKELHSAKNYLF